MKTQTTAKLRQLQISPRKVRLLVNLIRGRSVQDALVQLQFSKKHAALPVIKLLKSAVANAIHNHQIKEDSLIVKYAFVDAGKTLHRWMPRAFGRASKLRKRASHITIVLEGDADETKKKKVSKEKVEKAADDKKVESNEAASVKGESIRNVKKSAPAAKGKMNTSSLKKADTKRRGNK